LSTEGRPAALELFVSGKCYVCTMDDETTRMSIRLPDGLLARLRRVADRNRRSVHAQMLVFIERGLDQDDKEDQETRSQ
jgi:hypothetical protein